MPPDAALSAPRRVTRPSRRESVLALARTMVEHEGLPAPSLDRIADRLEMTLNGVLYCRKQLADEGRWPWPMARRERSRPRDPGRLPRPREEKPRPAPEPVLAGDRRAAVIRRMWREKPWRAGR